MRATVAALAGILLGSASRFQSESRTFVIRTDTDTLAVERLTLTPNTLTGDLQLPEELSSVHYVLHLRPDGSTESAEILNQSPRFYSGTIVFGSPSAVRGQAGVAGRLVAVPADYLPIIGVSMGMIDHLIRLHTPAVGEAVNLRVINIRNRNPGRLTIKRLTTDSVLVDCESCMRRQETEELRVGLAQGGGIDGAIRTEQHWVVRHR